MWTISKTIENNMATNWKKLSHVFYTPRFQVFHDSSLRKHRSLEDVWVEITRPLLINGDCVSSLWQVAVSIMSKTLMADGTYWKARGSLPFPLKSYHCLKLKVAGVVFICFWASVFPIFKLFHITFQIKRDVSSKNFVIPWLQE